MDRMPAASFNVTVYKSARAFHFPKKERDVLGIRGGDSIHLTIRDLSNRVLFSDRKILKSGSEIYGKDVASALEPGSIRKIEATEPRALETAAKEESFYAQERAAGFQSDHAIRKAVEDYAMRCAEATLSSIGFNDFTNTSANECYDYSCRRAGKPYFVEVKGTQGPGTSVILTRNEVEHGKRHAQSSIAVIVHDIRIESAEDAYHASGGTARVLAPWVIEQAALKPIQYVWQVPQSVSGSGA